MGSSLRGAIRLAAVAVWMFGVFVLGAPLLAVAAALGSRGAGLQARSLQLQARGILWLMGVRVSASGTPPRPPFFLVANHLSYLDVLVLSAQAPCAFVSKAEVAHWMVLGVLVQAYGTVFVERSRKGDLTRVMAAVQSRLRSGHGVVFFPEATSSDGSGVLPFHSSLFEAAVRAGSPVHCASLSYHAPEGWPPADESICWWREMPFWGHFWKLLGLPWVGARVAFAAEPLAVSERKELAERARQAVLALFVPSAVAREGAQP